LKHRALHVHVDTGTPVIGDFTTAINIDTGGTNNGTSQGCVFVTNTQKNPRLRVVFRKTTSTTAYEVRVAFMPALNDQVSAASSFSSGTANALFALVHDSKPFCIFRGGSASPYSVTSRATIALAAEQLGVVR
jgi:hypothetical protein